MTRWHSLRTRRSMAGLVQSLQSLRAALGWLRRQLRFYLARSRARLQRRLPMVQYHAGRLAAECDQPELAEVYIKRALQVWPDCGVFHLALGDALQQQSRWQEAAAAYQRAIATETPGDDSLIWAYHNLGDVESRQEHWQRAIAAYEVAAERQPDFFYSHYNLAQAYIQVSQLEAACGALERAIACRPNETELLLELAQVSAQAGNLHLRRNALERVIALAPSQPSHFQAYFDLAGVLRHQNETEQAAEVYLRSLDLDPNFNWWYHHSFWMSLKQADRLDDAREIFARHMQQYPDRTAPYINFGETLVYSDRIPESLAPYRQGLRQKLARSKPHYPIDAWDDRHIFGPNFIILGAQKAGTSSLFQYVIQHPQIIPPLRKELEFWSRRMDRGLDWYLSQFPAIPPGETAYLSGEACPGYLDHDTSADRLRHAFPEVKLIVILRDPVERAYSHYNHWLRRHQETRDFETAIAAGIDRLTSGADSAIDESKLWNAPHDYIARGVYIIFLRHWMSVFPRDRFLVLTNEQLNHAPQATLSRVFDFLELPDASITADLRHNVGTYLPITDTAQQRLQQFYAPYDRALADFLGRSFEWL